MVNCTTGTKDTLNKFHDVFKKNINPKDILVCHEVININNDKLPVELRGTNFVIDVLYSEKDVFKPLDKSKGYPRVIIQFYNTVDPLFNSEWYTKIEFNLKLFVKGLLEALKEGGDTLSKYMNKYSFKVSL